MLKKIGEKAMFEKLKSFCDSFLGLGVPGFDLVIYNNLYSVIFLMPGIP